MSDGKEIKAFAVYEAKAPIREFSYTPLPLRGGDVEVKIDCCGVCHSDLHQQQNDWGIANYPLVAGHEIVGHVTAVGTDVKDLKVGQRVGIGPQTGSCGRCRECLREEAQLCPLKDKSYNSATGDDRQPFTFGGFADRIRCRADWTFPIPDGLSSVQAAPLLCAGVTTWSPFVHHKIKAGDKVGVIGIGGLGHIAIQFAAKLGCEVTAISGSSDKEAEAKALGAHRFINSNDKKAMAAASKSIHFILATLSGGSGVDWNSYLQLLLPDGIFCIVGLPPTLTIAPKFIVFNRLNVCGSYLCSNADVRRMLQFCAQHNIVAQTEELPMTADNCNKALKKVDENAVRYRMVLVNGSSSTDGLHEHTDKKQRTA